MLEHWREVHSDHDSVNAEREMMRRVFYAVILVLAYTTVAAADSYEDAVSALLHGDHTRAVRLFRPLAEEGLASAQSHLGEMYRTGEGVTKDYQEALVVSSISPRLCSQFRWPASGYARSIDDSCGQVPRVSFN